MKALKKRRKLIITLAIIVVVIIVAVLVLRNKIISSAQTETVVQLEEIQNQDLSEYVTLSGTVSGENKTNYASSAASEVLAVNVSVGDTVKAGDVLAELDTTSIQDQIAALEKTQSNSEALAANTSKQNQQTYDQAVTDQQNQLKQADKSVDDAQDDLNDAQEELSLYNDELLKSIPDGCFTLTHYTEILDDLKDQLAEYSSELTASTGSDDSGEEEYTSPEAEELQNEITNLQERWTNYQAAEEKVKSAETALETAKNNLESVLNSTQSAVDSAANTIASEGLSTDDSTTDTQMKDLKKQLSDCKIVAQADGVVTSVNVTKGDVNTANATIITVENDQAMVLNASVDEKDILKISEGMKAVVTADATGDEEIAGEVIRVVRVAGASSTATAGDEGAAVSSSGNSYSAEIRLEDCELLTGMSAKAKITLKDQKDVLSVPYDLVQEDDNGQNYILCAEENEDGTYTAVRKDITIGDTEDYYSVVTGGDVKAGDYVIMDYSISEGDVFTGEKSESSSDATTDTTDDTDTVEVDGEEAEVENADGATITTNDGTVVQEGDN